MIAVSVSKCECQRRFGDVTQFNGCSLCISRFVSVSLPLSLASHIIIILTQIQDASKNVQYFTTKTANSECSL